MAVGKVAEAMMHPVRGRLFVAIAERPGISTGDLAERAGESIEKVRYHLRVLLRDGLVGVSSETRRRGVNERHYATLREAVVDAEEDSTLTQKERQAVALAIIRWIFADATSALSSQTLIARADRVVIRIAREVDRRGWEELVSIHTRAFEAAQQAMKRSAERLEAGAEERIAVTSANLLFETPM